LARTYYSRLFKEYCVADFSKYKEFKVGMRWRTEAEVKIGKGKLSCDLACELSNFLGQFICGGKGCEEKEGLNSYEVNFKYKEEGQVKNALVKLRVCPNCARKLNYKKYKEQKREERKRKREAKKEEKGQRRKLAKEEGSEVQQEVKEVTIKTEPRDDDHEEEEEEDEWVEKSAQPEAQASREEKSNNTDAANKEAAARLLESDIWRKPLSALIENISKGDEFDGISAPFHSFSRFLTFFLFFFFFFAIEYFQGLFP